jgi:hypothetical protein
MGGALAQQQPPAEGGAVAGTGHRGFLITLRCTSPNANALELVEKKFIPALLAIKPNAQQPDKEYAIQKAAMNWSVQIKEDAKRLGQMKQDYDNAVRAKETVQGRQRTPTPGDTGGGGMEGRGRGPGDLPGYNPGPGAGGGMEGGGIDNPGGAQAPQPGQLDDSPAYRDRLLDEDLKNDYEFTVLIAVALDPPPMQPATPTASAVP